MEVNFPNFKKIRSNFNSAFIIQFGYFWAVILQFLALRNPLPKIFFYKICVKWCFVVCANTLLLLEHYLTPWVFIWKHPNEHIYLVFIRSGHILYACRLCCEIWNDNQYYRSYLIRINSLLICTHVKCIKYSQWL